MLPEYLYLFSVIPVNREEEEDDETPPPPKDPK